MIALPGELLDAIRAGEAHMRLFLQLNHQGGIVRAWSGIGPVTWNGQTWLGTGALGAIEGVQHTDDMREHEVTFMLSGVDPALLGLAGDGVRNRDATVWARWMRDDGTFFDASMVLWAGLQDYADSEEDGGEGRISILARSPLADWAVASNVAWTHEEQIAAYPGDTGLDRIPELVNKEFAGWAGS